MSVLQRLAHPRKMKPMRKWKFEVFTSTSRKVSEKYYLGHKPLEDMARPGNNKRTKKIKKEFQQTRHEEILYSKAIQTANFHL
ncbi:hypothetical protein YC2023_052582 [Brassica napus]